MIVDNWMWGGMTPISKSYSKANNKYMKESEAYNPEQPSELNFSFGGHLATNSLGLVAKGFFLGPNCLLYTSDAADE